MILRGLADLTGFIIDRYNHFNIFNADDTVWMAEPKEKLKEL